MLGFIDTSIGLRYEEDAEQTNGDGNQRHEPEHPWPAGEFDEDGANDQTKDYFVEGTRVLL
ncbi:hypothetical protein PHLCEN_2v6904 [Hermanssonia centrifuga]|uniref:Uncharacterized protein n=1 Tax=Hermanssonia centrifuga TaxID=98765 RepID=A0A2R6NY62_9APHY|nr:hypothetical protein PHLCEN_2v6904 [Hermanssonia centrifuga]